MASAAGQGALVIGLLSKLYLEVLNGVSHWWTTHLKVSLPPLIHLYYRKTVNANLIFYISSPTANLPFDLQLDTV